MIILKCSQCNNIIAFDVSASGSFNSILKCPFCGFEDYYLSWRGGESSRVNGIVNQQTLNDILDVIKNIPEGGSANIAFDSLSRKYALSTMSLTQLANIIETDSQDFTLPNRHRFSRIETSTVKAEDILSLIHQEIRKSAAKAISENNIDDLSFNTESSIWEGKYMNLKKSYEKLKSEYDILRTRYISVENELKEYRDMWK